MKIKFPGLLSIDAVLKAVENEGNALRYVFDIAMFKKKLRSSYILKLRVFDRTTSLSI